MTVQQMDLLAYRADEPDARVHKTGTSTEKKAARSAMMRSGSHKARILRYLAAHHEGATAHELHAATGGAYPHVASTRCLSLMDAGFVVRTGETRQTPSGEDALLWFCTPKGRAEAARLTEGDV